MITKLRHNGLTYELLSVEGPLDKSHRILQRRGIDTLTAEELIRLKILTGVSSEISDFACYVAEGHVYRPRNPRTMLVTDGAHNPLLEHTREAASRHSKGMSFYVKDSKLQNRAARDVKEAIKSGVLAYRIPEIQYTSKGLVFFTVRVDELSENPYFQFMLREEAKPYAEFLEDLRAREVKVYIPDPCYISCPKHKGKPFANLVEVMGFSDWGGAFCGNWLLNPDIRLRGILRKYIERSGGGSGMKKSY